MRVKMLALALVLVGCGGQVDWEKKWWDCSSRCGDTQQCAWDSLEAETKARCDAVCTLTEVTCVDPGTVVGL